MSPKEKGSFRVAPERSLNYRFGGDAVSRIVSLVLHPIFMLVNKKSAGSVFITVV